MPLLFVALTVPYALIGAVLAKIVYRWGKDHHWLDVRPSAVACWIFWPVVFPIQSIFMLKNWLEDQEDRGWWTPWKWISENEYEKKARQGRRDHHQKQKLTQIEKKVTAAEQEKKERETTKREVSRARKKLQSINRELRRQND